MPRRPHQRDHGPVAALDQQPLHTPHQRQCRSQARTVLHTPAFRHAPPSTSAPHTQPRRQPATQATLSLPEGPDHRPAAPLLLLLDQPTTASSLLLLHHHHAQARPGHLGAELPASSSSTGAVRRRHHLIQQQTHRWTAGLPAHLPCSRSTRSAPLVMWASCAASFPSACCVRRCLASRHSSRGRWGPPP